MNGGPEHAGAAESGPCPETPAGRRRRCRYPGCGRELPLEYWYYCPEHHALVSSEFDMDMDGV